MNDAQTWTVIGGFLAILVAYTALVLGLVRAELRVMRAELGRLSDRIDHLDRDVQTVVVRMMGGDNT